MNTIFAGKCWVLALLYPFLMLGAWNVKGQYVMDGPILSCPGSEQEPHTVVTLPQAMLEIMPQPSTTSQSTLVVNYTGFPPQARQAFQYAVNIWQSILVSPVPIRINADWASLEANTLGSAGAATLYRDFAGSTRTGTWYPVALAERLAGEELNPVQEPDIVAIFNSNINWYYGTDGNTPSGQYNLVSVVLHEIAHGLGFFSSFTIEGNAGFGGEQNFPFIYDTFIEDRSQQRLVDMALFPNGSARLATALTSDNLFFDAPVPDGSSRQSLPRLYAPFNFRQGSSISHLDENTYPSGDPNSLMTPRIGRAESVYWPGEVSLSMLTAMGWRTRRPGTEDNPVVLFPNPTNRFLTVDAIFEDNVQNVSILVTDVTGKQMMAASYQGLRKYFVEQLNFGTLPAGLYLITVTTPDETYTQKVMINR